MESLENHHCVDEGSKKYSVTASAQYCDLQLLKTELVSSLTKNIYVPIRKISHGHFSTVFLSFNKTEKKYVAIKICKCDPEYETAFEEECQILKVISKKMKSLQIPDNGGIVQIIDNFIYEQKTLSDDFEVTVTKRHYCFVMELLGHSTFKLMLRYAPTINANKAIPIPIVKTIAKSLLQSLVNLHRCGYIHTDIKPENISLKYFLPEIDINADYKVAELIYGKQSTYLFDSKLCTAAKYINSADFERLQSGAREEVQNYLSELGAKRGYVTWLDINSKVMDCNRYKTLLERFLEDNEVSPDDYGNVYKINGLNVFNVANLMKEAEKLFRITFIPQQLSYKDAIINITKEQFVAGDPSAPNGAANQKNTIVLKSAKSQLDKLKGEENREKDKPIEYHLLSPDQLDVQRSVLTSPLGIEFGICNVRQKSPEMQFFAEKLYFDENEPKTIYKLASSGLHSRFALYRMVNDNGLWQEAKCDNVSLPKYNKQDFKCFALTNNNQLVYPVMISYYRRNSLIPFCAEMFQIKLLDLGNAYLIDNHRPSIIQTRQYRSPEVIVGINYNETADVFSAACVIFELLTGNYLFPTKSQSDEYRRDNLHLKQIVRILGSHGIDYLKKNGNKERWAKIEKHGDINQLGHTPISTVLVNEYNFDECEARQIEQFLEPMLRINQKERISAAEALKNSWLNTLGDGDYLINYGGRQL